MKDKPEGEVNILSSDIRKYYSKASTKGGQNANKNENCVSIHHIPTGIQVVCKDTKSKIKNEELAMQELERRIKERSSNKHNQKTNQHRKDQIETSNARRTYQANESYALDHKTGKRMKLKEVLKGKIDKFYG